jgi:hypothetical protein
VDFNVHDWVGVEVPDDETESGARKVAGLAVDIDADGVVQYEATLSSRFEVRAVKTQRLLDKLGASERSGSGGAASSPIPVSKAISTVNLADLSDVDLTAPAPGSLLQYSGGRWVDVVANLDLLADVETAGTSAPANGQALLYDTASGLWKPGTVAAGGSAPDVVWRTSALDTATSVYAGNVYCGYSFYVSVACKVKKFKTKINGVAGADYKLQLVRLTADTRTVAEVLGSSTVTCSTTGALLLEWPAISWQLTAGERYGLIFRRVGTTNVSILYVSGNVPPPSAYAYSFNVTIDALMHGSDPVVGATMANLGTCPACVVTLGM